MSERVVSEQSDPTFTTVESARRYTEHMEPWGIMYRDFLAHLQRLKPGATMLEIGAGTGLLTRHIAETFPGAAITALEISEPMARVGREYLHNKGVGDRVEWVVGDAEDPLLLGKLEYFDLVYSGLVLHEFRHPRETFARLYERVAPGGALCLLDLRRVWWLRWLPGNGGLARSIRASFQPEELEVLMRNSSRSGPTEAEVRAVFPFLLIATLRKG